MARPFVDPSTETSRNLNVSDAQLLERVATRKHGWIPVDPPVWVYPGIYRVTIDPVARYAHSVERIAGPHDTHPSRER